MTQARLPSSTSLSPLGRWLTLLSAVGAFSAWAEGQEACPVPANARSAYPRKILAVGEQPWSLKRPPPRSEPLAPALVPPAGSLERRHLIRRLTFVLTGLPPRADDADAFIADPSPRALEKVVDRLQASPAAGERFAHWWLDLVGYTDRWSGLPPDSAQPVYAWRYRDWLIEAFNESMRLSQLVRLHLIGDTLPGPEPGVPHRAGLTATTWFLFGPAPRGTLSEASPALARHQADRTARLFLGADFSCARCHDHPALPLRSAEHASWVSLFSHHHSLLSTADGSLALSAVPTVSAKRLAQRKRELAVLTELEAKLAADHRDFSRTAAAEFLPQTAEYVRSAWAWHRQPRGTVEEFCSERGLLAAPFRRWLALLGLSESPQPASSPPWWKAWAEARTSGEPRNIAEAAREIERLHTADESSPFFDLSPEAAKWLTLDQQTQLSRLEKKIAALRQMLTGDEPVHAIAEGPAPGTAATGVPPRLPALLVGALPNDLIPPTSGRLALWTWLDGPGRPLLARLFTHRLWIACGQPPLITQELDWWRPEPPGEATRLETLAAALQTGDGSLISLQKQILLSAPRGNPLTLSEAERRDAVLFASGQLDPRQLGPPSAAPDSRRRSLYRTWTEPRKSSPLLGLFLQTQAETLVQLALEQAGPSPDSQIHWLTRRLLQRPPSDQERLELGDTPDRAALAAFCLTLFQSDEFRVLQ